MSTIEKVSNKSDIEQKIQKLRNEEMKIFNEYQKETKELYDKKYRQKKQVIIDTINQLQNKKEADQA